MFHLRTQDIRNGCKYLTDHIIRIFQLSDKLSIFVWMLISIISILIGTNQLHMAWFGAYSIYIDYSSYR